MSANSEQTGSPESNSRVNLVKKRHYIAGLGRSGSGRVGVGFGPLVYTARPGTRTERSRSSQGWRRVSRCKASRLCLALRRRDCGHELSAGAEVQRKQMILTWLLWGTAHRNGEYQEHHHPVKMLLLWVMRHSSFFKVMCQELQANEEKKLKSPCILLTGLFA